MRQEKRASLREQTKGFLRAQKDQIARLKAIQEKQMGEYKARYDNNAVFHKLVLRNIEAFKFSGIENARQAFDYAEYCFKKETE